MKQEIGHRRRSKAKSRRVEKESSLEENAKGEELRAKGKKQNLNDSIIDAMRLALS